MASNKEQRSTVQVHSVALTYFKVRSMEILVLSSITKRHSAHKILIRQKSLVLNPHYRQC